MFETLYTFRTAMSDKFPKVPAKVLHPVTDLVYESGSRNYVKAVSEIRHLLG